MELTKRPPCPEVVQDIGYTKGVYKVSVIRLADDEPLVYGVINTTYGVVEAVQNMLPSAMDMCDRLDEWSTSRGKQGTSEQNRQMDMFKMFQ